MKYNYKKLCYGLANNFSFIMMGYGVGAQDTLVHLLGINLLVFSFFLALKGWNENE